MQLSRILAVLICGQIHASMSQKIPAVGKNATVLISQVVRVYFSASFLPTFKLSKLSIVLSTSE
jgi:hypothetical protein